MRPTLPGPRILRSLSLVTVAVLLVLPVVGAERLRQDGRVTVREGRPEASRGEGRRDRTREAARLGLRPAAREGIELSAYRHLGSWIDIYNHWPWDHPVAAVEKLRRKGVRTIFLQTSNYGAKNPIYRPKRAGLFIHAARSRNMRVVAWYVPSFAHPKVDRHRSIAAIRFRNRWGERFDSFGMDIEATVVGHIWKRNRRLLGLSKWLRRKAGPRYALGAITPDPVSSLYWPRFPYERVRRLYDVFVPMGYFSFRAKGYEKVKRYTAESIRTIRQESGDPRVPIHVIGGIGGETKGSEVKGFVRALKKHEALGGSYYDFTITTPEEWAQLGVIAGRPKPENKPKKPPAAVPAPKRGNKLKSDRADRGPSKDARKDPKSARKRGAGRRSKRSEKKVSLKSSSCVPAGSRDRAVRRDCEPSARRGL